MSQSTTPGEMSRSHVAGSAPPPDERSTAVVQPAHGRYGLMTKMYRIHSSLSSDINEGVVWVRDPSIKSAAHGRRRIIRIRYPAAGKQIFCEVLYADDMYMEHFIDALDARERFEQQFAENLNASRAAVQGKSHRLRHLRRSKNVLYEALAQYRPDKLLKKAAQHDAIMFMGAWHRTSLGLPDTPITRQLETEIADDWLRRFWWQFLAGLGHPQLVVFLANVLAILGLGAGLIGLGFGLVAFARDLGEAFGGGLDLPYGRPILGVVAILSVVGGGVVNGFALRALTRRNRHVETRAEPVTASP